MLELVASNDPILKNKVTEVPPVDTREACSRELKAYLKSFHRAVGLSANQMGIPLRFFVMRTIDDVIACFNPYVVSKSEILEYQDEGCLSFPGIFCKIKRPIVVTAHWENEKGEVFEKLLSGDDARIFQHELDHLDGITFLDRATKFHRQKALDKRKTIL